MMLGPITSAADWAAVFRARAADLRLSHRDVDSRADLADGYFSKIVAGMKDPTASTIARICSALDIEVHAEKSDVRRPSVRCCENNSG